MYTKCAYILHPFAWQVRFYWIIQQFYNYFITNNNIVQTHFTLHSSTVNLRSARVFVCFCALNCSNSCVAYLSCIWDFELGGSRLLGALGVGDDVDYARISSDEVPCVVPHSRAKYTKYALFCLSSKNARRPQSSIEPNYCCKRNE